MRDEFGTTVLITVEKEDKCEDDRKESEMDGESVEEGSPANLLFVYREKGREEEATDECVGTSTCRNEEDEGIE